MRFLFTALFSVFFLYSSIAQTISDELTLMGNFGSKNSFSSWFVHQGGERHIIYFYSEDCDACISSLEEVYEEYKETIAQGIKPFMISAITVIKDPSNKASVKKWRDRFADWSMNRYYTLGEHYDHLVDDNTGYVAVYENERKARGYSVPGDDQFMLREAIVQHPLLNYHRNKEEIITRKDKANLITEENQMPFRTEHVLREYNAQSEEWGPILSISNTDVNPEKAPANAMTITPTSIGTKLEYFKNGQRVDLQEEIEVYTTYGTMEKATLNVPTEGPFIRVFDHFTLPAAQHPGKDKKEYTLYRRVSIRDMDDNLLWYMLFKGFDDEVLESWDFSEVKKNKRIETTPDVEYYNAFMKGAEERNSQANEEEEVVEESEPEDDRILLLSENGSTVEYNDQFVEGSSKRKAIIDFIFSEDCKSCITNFTKIAKENADYFEGPNSQYELRTFYVAKNGITPEDKQKWSNVTKSWPSANYFDYQGQFSDLANKDKAYVITYLEGMLVREVPIGGEDATTLNEALIQHPLISYTNSKDDAAMSPREKADAVFIRHILDGKIEEVLRDYDAESGEWGAVLSIEGKFFEGSPQTSLLFSPQIIGSKATYFKNSKEVKSKNSYTIAESYSDARMIQNLPLKVPTDEILTEITDYITEPAEFNEGKDIKEYTVYRRVITTDFFENIVSYKLYSGYDDELLESYDLSDRPRFKPIEEEGDIEVDIEVVEEDDVEDIVVSTEVTESEEEEVVIEEVEEDDENETDAKKKGKSRTLEYRYLDEQFNKTSKEKAAYFSIDYRLEDKTVRMTRFVYEGEWSVLVKHEVGIDEGAPQTGLVIAPDENGINGRFWYEGKAVKGFDGGKSYAELVYLDANYEETSDENKAVYMNIVDYFTTPISDVSGKGETIGAILSINTVMDMDLNLVYYTVNERFLQGQLERFDYREEK